MIGSLAALALLAAAALVGAFGQPVIAGIALSDLVAILLFASGALWLTAWASERARSGWADAAGAVVMWAIFLASLTGVYLNREAAMDGLRAIAEDINLSPPVATVTGAGEVAFARRRNGTFLVPAQVNGRDQSFMFDTGASTVVLTPDSARELGFRDADLHFRVQVLTANGRMMAAPVTIERLAIGPIALSRVPALVAGPGLLHENLLGQTVLDRLESYEVRGNRLVLRARKS